MAVTHAIRIATQLFVDRSQSHVISPSHHSSGEFQDTASHIEYDGVNARVHCVFFVDNKTCKS